MIGEKALQRAVKLPGESLAAVSRRPLQLGGYALRLCGSLIGLPRHHGKHIAQDLREHQPQHEAALGVQEFQHGRQTGNLVIEAVGAAHASKALLKANKASPEQAARIATQLADAAINPYVASSIAPDTSQKAAQLMDEYLPGRLPTSEM